MQQQTLGEFVGSESLWGTGTCPVCRKECASLNGVKRHYSAHDGRYNKDYLEFLYGVPAEWLLRTLHHVLRKPILQMSRELPLSRYGITTLMDSVGVSHRDSSEAEALRWAEMDEKQRKHQLSAAHERNRELFSKGEGGYQVWERNNPEKAAEIRRELGSRLHEVRERNGMAGVSGEDSPTWRGGHEHKDRIQKLLPGDPFYSQRKAVLERDNYTCQMCGAKAEELNREPHVHHIIPVLSGGTNATDLLITLCVGCHTTAEHYSLGFTDRLLTEKFER